MGLFKWAAASIKTLTIWDMGILKICLIAFTLTIAKLVPDVLALDWYWYGLIFAVTYVLIMTRMFKKR